MRAVVYTESGDTSVLELVERDVPEPGPGEVRVRIVRAGVNPTDWKFRAGGMGKLAFPEIVPGQDGAGVVEAVGPDVTGLAVGDRVWTMLAQHQRPTGTAQELTVLPVDRVHRLPEGASFDLGADLGVPAVTAHRALTTLEDGPSRLAPGALAGRTVGLSIKVVRVQESRLPAVDEAFAASFGVKEGGLAKFREDVRANLERELKGVLMARLKSGAVEKLVDAYPDLEVPQGMIENEAQSLARQAGAEGPDAFASYLPPARRRVSAGLLIAELARQNEIRLEPNRVSEALATIASTYEEPEKVVELYTRDPQLMSALQNRALEDQVVEWMAEHAKHSEQHMSFNEVMRPGA